MQNTGVMLSHGEHICEYEYGTYPGKMEADIHKFEHMMKLLTKIVLILQRICPNIKWRKLKNLL